jgi:hypothetical protein
MEFLQIVCYITQNKFSDHAIGTAEAGFLVTLTSISSPLPHRGVYPLYRRAQKNHV